MVSPANRWLRGGSHVYWDAISWGQNKMSKTFLSSLLRTQYISGQMSPAFLTVDKYRSPQRSKWRPLLFQVVKKIPSLSIRRDVAKSHPRMGWGG